MDAIQEVVTQTLVDLILAGLALLAVYATNALHKVAHKAKLETNQIKNAEQRKLLINAIEDIENLTTKTVANIEQTTAKELRLAIQQGIADKDELQSLSIRAFNEISRAFQPEAKAVIEKNFGSFSNYLTKTIETKVLELKNANR